MKYEIEGVVLDLLEQDAWSLITPGTVYHAMKKRGRCCGCFPNVIALIVEVSEKFHQSRATPPEEFVPFIQKIRAEQEKCETARMLTRKARMRQSAA
jgi:hypothetical protein